MENRRVRNLGEVLRDEMVMKDEIITLLQNGPKTIPEIAGALGFPSHEVMQWVMAMWRYGKLEETGKANDDGYFQYQLKE
jgi:hypothetical protein